MQKWEYTVAEIVVSHNIVRSINGESLGKPGGAFSHPTFPPLIDFLKSLGEQGWEIVGAGNNGSNEGTGISYIIAKRPIP